MSFLFSLFFKTKNKFSKTKKKKKKALKPCIMLPDKIVRTGQPKDAFCYIYSKNIFMIHLDAL